MRGAVKHDHPRDADTCDGVGEHSIKGYRKRLPRPMPQRPLVEGRRRHRRGSRVVSEFSPRHGWVPFFGHTSSITNTRFFRFQSRRGTCVFSKGLVLSRCPQSFQAVLRTRERGGSQGEAAMPPLGCSFAWLQSRGVAVSAPVWETTVEDWRGDGEPSFELRGHLSVSSH
jgi:hypothetical protein